MVITTRRYALRIRNKGLPLQEKNNLSHSVVDLAQDPVGSDTFLTYLGILV
jgi:hypothetical protein